MICYTYDQWGNYTGEHVHVKYQPLPARYTETKPPEGDYPVWRGAWELWDQAARPPEPDPEVVKQARIADLKQLLADTDYVALTDYDKSKPDVIAQRQEWRDEIRELEPSDEAPVAPE